MKKSSKVLSLFLALATVISAGSCGGGGGRTQPVATNESGEAAPVETAAPLTSVETYDTDEALQNAVANVEVNAEELVKPEKKLKWLSWWVIDETGAEAELFKAQFGVPEEGNEAYGDYANNIFEFRQCSYSARYDMLATMVSSGDSPDMFPFEIGYFPLSAYKGMFQPLDGIVDTTTEDWSNTREAMDKFMWGGKNYCPITVINIAYLWFYRRSIVEEAGIKDPYELYRNGEWNWDTFLEMADQFQKTGDNKAIVDGYYVPRTLICSTGTPLIGIENGKLVSNLKNSNIERTMDLVSTLASQHYAYDLQTNNYNPNTKAWANGDTLFMVDGMWYYYETAAKLAKKYKFTDVEGKEYEDIFFVPSPRDPNADAYYQEYKVDPYMLVAGSKNVDGYKAWMSCVLAASKDETVKAASREKDKRDRFWTDEQLDFLDELSRSNAIKGVFDFRNGISTSCADTTSGQAPTDKLINDPYKFTEETYTNLRSQFEGEIMSAIDELNASIS